MIQGTRQALYEEPRRQEALKEETFNFIKEEEENKSKEPQLPAEDLELEAENTKIDA